MAVVLDVVVVMMTPTFRGSEGWSSSEKDCNVLNVYLDSF
jgi:hypothetical protein